MIKYFRNLFQIFWNHRFFRFLVIGGVNTLFGYSIFALLIFIGIHYTIALFVGTVFGVLFNFKTTGLFVFRNKKNRLILKFITVYIVIYLINVLVLSIFNRVGINNYVGGALAILPMAYLAYLLNKYFVYA